MSEVVLEDAVLRLPKGILEIAKEKNIATRLSSKVIEQYYYSELRKNLKKLFVEYNDSKWIIKSKDYDCLRSVNYENDNVSSTKKHGDKVSDYVAELLEIEEYILKFYRAIMSVARELTLQEAVYLVDSLFCDRPEELISDKLSISVKTLTKVKKSCLVKVYLEFTYLGLNV